MSPGSAGREPVRSCCPPARPDGRAGGKQRIAPCSIPNLDRPAGAAPPGGERPVLLLELDGHTDRRARYVCEVVVLGPTGARLGAVQPISPDGENIELKMVQEIAANRTFEQERAAMWWGRRTTSASRAWP